MIFVQISHSLFFALLNCVLYLKYNNGTIKPIYVYSLIIIFFSLFLYNHFFNGISNHLFLFTLMFSVSFVILQFMKKFVTVFENNKELEKRNQLKETILSIQDFIINKIFIIGLFLYQLLLIWFPGIFEKISEQQ